MIEERGEKSWAVYSWDKLRKDVNGYGRIVREHEDGSVDIALYDKGANIKELGGRLQNWGEENVKRFSSPVRLADYISRSTGISSSNVEKELVDRFPDEDLF